MNLRRSDVRVPLGGDVSVAEDLLDHTVYALLDEERVAGVVKPRISHAGRRGTYQLTTGKRSSKNDAQWLPVAAIRSRSGTCPPPCGTGFYV